MAAASSAIDRARAAVARTIEAVVSGPRAAIAWVRREPSRAFAYVWIAGLVAFSWITYRRAYRKYKIAAAEEAALAAASPPKPKRPPEVIQMMDVDDLNQTRIDRMHELGLAAEGEDHAPDPKTIAAAHAARTKAVASEGEQVYGDDDVVVVSKGGIEGWIKRNRDKKPDPETLAWLRGEEKKDGIKAYASWLTRR